MLMYKIDNYEVHTKVHNRTNKVVNIKLDNEVKTGWIVSNKIKDIDLLEMSIKSIKRYEEGLKSKSLEDFLNI